MKLIIRTFLAIALLFTTNSAFSQADGQLSGTLRNDSGRVLANINVQAFKQSVALNEFADYQSTRTDGYGGYAFNNLEYGVYHLLFTDDNFISNTDEDPRPDTGVVYEEHFYGNPTWLGQITDILIQDSQVIVLNDSVLRTIATDNRLPTARVSNCIDFGTAAEPETFAAALANGQVINFECSGTLIVPEIVITQDTIINGQAGLILSGNSSNRVMRVQPGIQLTIDNVELSNGNASYQGGGLHNLGFVTIRHSKISENSARSTGGGIYNRGQLELVETTFISNIATSVAALENHGRVTGGFVVFEGAISSAGTSLIENNGSLELSYCEISQARSNNVYAISNTHHSQITLNKCEISDNLTSLITNDGTLTITHSSLDNNIGDQELIRSTGVVNISSTSITNNNQSSTMLWNSGLADITNTTISNNSGGTSRMDPALNNSGLMTISHSTIAENYLADISINQINNSGELILSNTIIVGTGNGLECGGTTRITSSGYNLHTDGSCGEAQATDIPFGYAGLEALDLNGALDQQNANGGIGLSHALQVGSDAIDNGNCNGSVPIDQRGISRPQGNTCDIGAYESEAQTQAQACIDTSPMGDGWGWNGTESCRVSGELEPSSTCIDSPPIGDGWGWDGTASCRVTTVEPGSVACVDSSPLGNGWGWDGSQSCRVTTAEPEPTTCIDSPPINDGWGWDGTSSCRITTSQDPTTDTCIDYTPIGDGWGWNGTESCRT